MVDYREILRLNNLGYTKKDIASSVHSSRNTVSWTYVNTLDTKS